MLTGPESHGASTCRWAAPTVFLGAPFWFEAEQTPWTCVHDARPRLLHTTECCATCARWERELAPASESTDSRAATASPAWQDWLSGYPAPHEASDRS
jgi:hypothetical protein